MQFKDKKQNISESRSLGKRALCEGHEVQLTTEEILYEQLANYYIIKYYEYHETKVFYIIFFPLFKW